MNSIIFRCQASPLIGMGHLVRSRVLAKYLNLIGYKCIMVGPDKIYKLESDNTLFDQWLTRTEWIEDNDEINFMDEISIKYNAKHIIMDDYRSNGKVQLDLRDKGYVILQQYDASIPQKFAAQLVINSSPAERRDKYEPNFLISPITTLHGPEYSILRDGFLKTKLLPFSHFCKRILISFGGGDDRGNILFVLDSLYKRIPIEIELNVMVSKNNPNIRNIQNWITDHSDISVRLHVNPLDVPELISKCNLAILSGGTTTFEAAYCGVPMILLPIAPNQSEQCIGWGEIGAAISLTNLGMVDNELVCLTVNSLINDPEKRKSMSKAGKKAVDGKGAKRIINTLIDYKR